jgi:hypothetical protein
MKVNFVHKIFFSVSRHTTENCQTSTGLYSRTDTQLYLGEHLMERIMVILAMYYMHCYCIQIYFCNRWLKDGTTLRNGRKYLIEGSILTLRRAIKSDEGLYECFAENSLGFARHSVRLNVRGKLYINYSPS